MKLFCVDTNTFLVSTEAGVVLRQPDGDSKPIANAVAFMAGVKYVEDQRLGIKKRATTPAGEADNG